MSEKWEAECQGTPTWGITSATCTSERAAMLAEIARLRGFVKGGRDLVLESLSEIAKAHREAFEEAARVIEWDVSNEHVRKHLAAAIRALAAKASEGDES